MLSVISRISVGAVQPGLGQDVADLVHDLGARELPGGQVDRHVERRVHRELALQLHRVGARFAKHPAADRHDQSRLFRERDELERLHDPALRVDPSDQGLHAGDPSRLELDHRLVMEDELLVLERALEVGLQFKAAQRGVVHRGLEDLVATLALLLRHVHRDVGVAHERLRDLFAAVTGFLRDGDPDARADENLLALQRERLLEHLHDPVGDVRSLDALPAVLQQDRELVPTQPGGGVGSSERFLQPVADLQQEPVAGGVAEGVVDRLEVVDVHEQHCDGFAVALLALDGVQHAVAEQRPVREVGDGVVERLVLQLLLELLALRDVTGVQDDPLHVWVMQQARPQGLGGQVRSVPMLDAELQERGVALSVSDRRQER